MKLFLKILIYLFAVALTALSAFLLHSYYLILVLTVIIIVPVFIELWFVYMYKKIRFDFYFTKNILQREENTDIIVRIKAFCLIGSCDFDIETGNNYFDKLKYNVNMSLPPFITTSKAITIIPEEIGIYKANIQNIVINDVFGLLKKTIPFNKTISAVVMPDKKNIDNIYSGLVQLDNNNSTDYYNSLSGDISGVKEYEKGQRLSAIHWKATAKADDIFIRNYENVASDEYIILFDFNINYIKSSFDYLYTIGSRLSDEGKSYYIMWLSRGRESLNEVYVSSKEKLDNVIIKMYSDSPMNNENYTINTFRKLYGNTNAIYISEDWKLI